MEPIVQYYVCACALSDVGRVREHNEDFFIIANLSRKGMHRESNGLLRFPSGPQGSLFTVADGMGGAAAGEIASKLGVQTLYRELQELIPTCDASEEDALEEILIEAVGASNRHIYELSTRKRELRGMGTTLTIVLELNGRLIIGQIGDSRAYLLRGDFLRQLTRDQSLVAQRVSAGFLTEEEARRHPERNVLLQALGVTDSVELGLSRVTLYPGDIVLLCSDGLHGLMSSDEVYGTIAKSSGLEDACQRLVGLANSRGGPDNITAVMAQFLPARSMGFYGAIEQEEESGLFDFR